MPNTFKRKVTKSAGIVPTSVGAYVVPVSTQTTVIGLVVANITTVNILVDVSLFAATIDYFIVKGAPIPPGGSIVVVGGDQKVVMETGDELRIVSSIAASVDAVMSILEITP